MSTPVDVLAVMDELIDFEERHAEYEIRQNLEAREARAAVAELIEADEAFDVAYESWQHGSLPFLAYKEALDRRRVALARVKGGAQ